MSNKKIVNPICLNPVPYKDNRPKLKKIYEMPISKLYEEIANLNPKVPRIGRWFNQDGHKPIMVIAPFFSSKEKDADQILKDFLNGLNSDELQWENVCFHYFFPRPMRMTYQEFLDVCDLFIRPKGVTQADYFNALTNQNIYNKLSVEGAQYRKKILSVDYRSDNMDYEFVRNSAGYLVEADKSGKKRNFDEYYMQNNYIEEQLLGVKYLKKVIDKVQPYKIIFTDHKTAKLVMCAFENEKRFEKHVERIKTRIREKAKRIKDFEDFLKMELPIKCIERYKQYIRDWYKQARDWEITVYIEKRDAEASKENWTFGETFYDYLSDKECQAWELYDFDFSLQKNEHVSSVPPHPTTKPVGNGAEALFGKLERDLGATLEKNNLYKKYEREFKSRAFVEAQKLVSKLKKGNSADEDITDADIDTIISGLYPEKFGILKFVLWKNFIDNLETDEPAQKAFLDKFRDVVALRSEQKSTAEPSSGHPQEDRNERLKQALKSDNRIHRLNDLDVWVNALGGKIDGLKNYIAGDEEEKFIGKDGLLELIDDIQGVQAKIAEIVKKMKELGDAREVREEPKKTVRNPSSLQGNKKDARLVLKEKMKKQ